MTTPVFLHYSQQELDDAFDQSKWAANRAECIARYDSESHRTGKKLAFETLSYGPGADEQLDFFPADASRCAPLQVFVHGGAWRIGHRERYRFVANAFVPHGIHCAVLGFSTIEAGGLPHMVGQVARALRFLSANTSTLGIDAAAVTLMGHSSGAHIAACLLAGAKGDLPPRTIGGAVLLGGVYELRPVLLSARSRYVSLLPEEEDRLSPMRHVEKIQAAVVVAYGEGESPEFKRQANELSSSLAAHGRLYRSVELGGCNHFEALLQLSEDGELAALAREIAVRPRQAGTLAASERSA